MKNLLRLGAAGIAATILSSQMGVAKAAEFKVLATIGVKAVLDDLVLGFERATGHKVTIVYGTTGGLRVRPETCV